MIPKTKLTDHFAKIFVISMDDKADRREALLRNLAETGLAAPEDITWVRALPGKRCPAPAWFTAGSAAWGCLQSHLRVVQDAILDSLENYLVLEDDVYFHATAGVELERLMAGVPADWGQIYLGGQHLRAPEAVEGQPFLFRCRNVNRTHAFALRGSAFAAFQQHITHAPDYIGRGDWHIDHQLGIAHGREEWTTYAPTWWLAGQAEGASNISGKTNPRFWWQYEGFSRNLPFTWIDPSDTALDQEALLQRFHFGNTLKPGTVEDEGLDACVDSPLKLGDFLRLVAREAMDRWKIPAIRHPRIGMTEIGYLWSAGVQAYEPERAGSLAEYPGNGLFLPSSSLALG